MTRRNTCRDCGGACWYERCHLCRRRYERDYGRGFDVELTGGRWVPRDGIMRWEADPEPPPTPADVLRDAHRRYWLGHRDAATIEGEREYQVQSKRRQRQRVAW